MPPQQKELTIYEALRESVNDGMSAEDAADNVLKRVSRNTLVEFVRPLLINEARRYVRADTRKIEREVVVAIENGTDPITARKKLAEEQFWVPGKGYVAWLDATVQDHLTVAKYLRQQAAAQIQTAELHENDARAILDAGVKCLRDIKQKR